MSGVRSNRRRVLRGTVCACVLGLAGCVTETNGGNGIDRSQTEGTGTSTGADTTERETTENVPGTDGEDQSTPDTAGGGPQTVSFSAPHGATIAATRYGSGDCGVVLVPQINRDRDSWKPQAEMLAERGYQVLAIDEDPDDRPASVHGAITYLHEQRDVSTLVLFGASSGGEAVVVANAEAAAGTVDGTIALSASGGVGHAPDLQGRSLFVVSTNDDARFVRVARELHEGAPEPTTLVEYEGSAHGQGIFETEDGDDLLGRIRTLLSAACEG